MQRYELFESVEIAVEKLDDCGIENASIECEMDAGEQGVVELPGSFLRMGLEGSHWQ
jgi:hypothetical protein